MRRSLQPSCPQCRATTRVMDHFGINCADFAKAWAFYDEVLGVLGYSRQMDFGAESLREPRLWPGCGPNSIRTTSARSSATSMATMSRRSAIVCFSWGGRSRRARRPDAQHFSVAVAQLGEAVLHHDLADEPFPHGAVEVVGQDVEADVPAAGVLRGVSAVGHCLLQSELAACRGRRQPPPQHVRSPLVHKLVRRGNSDHGAVERLVTGGFSPLR